MLKEKNAFSEAIKEHRNDTESGFTDNFLPFAGKIGAIAAL